MANDLTIGEMFPAGDAVARWFFNLSHLADDLSIFESQMHESFEDPMLPTVTYFRLIVARAYEGRAVVEDMDTSSAVASFVSEIGEAVEPAAALRTAYRRDRSLPRGEQSEVDRCLGRARHLTVHYSRQPGELARILRDAKHIMARTLIDDHSRALRNLWAQDVMEHHLWPEPERRISEVQLVHDLKEAFASLFMAMWPVYYVRAGINEMRGEVPVTSHGNEMGIKPEPEGP